VSELGLNDFKFDDGGPIDREFEKWRRSIERANNWEVTGACTFDEGAGGFVLKVHTGRGDLIPAIVATGGISARVSASVLGQGNIYLKRRTPGGPNVVADTATSKCYNPFSVAIPVGTEILVGPDQEAYQVAGADCPA
jgi:hypothetical protein